eukprot:GHVQ01043622.1.p1 GENE.GHVQ01043622.1~~GHVQ01043622.1.p1  ORF type:complete len:1138 (+),score=179.53 GHVQ01043622.1:252-3416(+)
MAHTTAPHISFIPRRVLCGRCAGSCEEHLLSQQHPTEGYSGGAAWLVSRQLLQTVIIKPPSLSLSSFLQFPSPSCAISGKQRHPAASPALRVSGSASTRALYESTTPAVRLLLEKQRLNPADSAAHDRLTRGTEISGVTTTAGGVCPVLTAEDCKKDVEGFLESRHRHGRLYLIKQIQSVRGLNSGKLAMENPLAFLERYVSPTSPLAAWGGAAVMCLRFFELRLREQGRTRVELKEDEVVRHERIKRETQPGGPGAGHCYEPSLAATSGSVTYMDEGGALRFSQNEPTQQQQTRPARCRWCASDDYKCITKRAGHMSSNTNMKQGKTEQHKEGGCSSGGECSYILDAEEHCGRALAASMCLLPPSFPPHLLHQPSLLSSAQPSQLPLLSDTTETPPLRHPAPPQPSNDEAGTVVRCGSLTLLNVGECYLYRGGKQVYPVGYVAIRRFKALPRTHAALDRYFSLQRNSASYLDGSFPSRMSYVCTITSMSHSAYFCIDLLTPSVLLSSCPRRVSCTPQVSAYRDGSGDGVATKYAAADSLTAAGGTTAAGRGTTAAGRGTGCDGSSGTILTCRVSPLTRSFRLAEGPDLEVVYRQFLEHWESSDERSTQEGNARSTQEGNASERWRGLSVEEVLRGRETGYHFFGLDMPCVVERVRVKLVDELRQRVCKQALLRSDGSGAEERVQNRTCDFPKDNALTMCHKAAFNTRWQRMPSKGIEPELGEVTEDPCNITFLCDDLCTNTPPSPLFPPHTTSVHNKHNLQSNSTIPLLASAAQALRASLAADLFPPSFKATQATSATAGRATGGGARVFSAHDARLRTDRLRRDGDVGGSSEWEDMSISSGSLSPYLLETVSNNLVDDLKEVTTIRVYQASYSQTEKRAGGRMKAHSKFDDMPPAMQYRYLLSLPPERRLEMRSSRIHGFGLFCTEDIPMFEPVVEYVGDLIRNALADKREKQNEMELGGDGSCYMFRLDDLHVVDATRAGNMGRFINHSCEPNCVCRVTTCEREHKHIVIFAKTHLEAGTEITYDYQFNVEEESEKLQCRCGAPSCLGRMN